MMTVDLNEKSPKPKTIVTVDADVRKDLIQSFEGIGRQVDFLKEEQGRQLGRALIDLSQSFPRALFKIRSEDMGLIYYPDAVRIYDNAPDPHWIVRIQFTIEVFEE